MRDYIGILQRAQILFGNIKTIENEINSRIDDIIKIIHEECGDPNLLQVNKDSITRKRLHPYYELSISKIENLLKPNEEEYNCIEYFSAVETCKTDLYVYNKYLEYKYNLIYKYKNFSWYIGSRFIEKYIIMNDSDIRNDVKRILKYGKEEQARKNNERKKKRIQTLTAKKNALAKLTCTDRKSLGIKC